MKQNERESLIVFSLIGLIFPIWAGLLIAPYSKGGLPEIFSNALTVFNDPFYIELCSDSLKTVLVFVLIYGMCIGVYLSSAKNYRRGEEHGSAKWGDAGMINRKYSRKPASENKIMTQNVSVSINAREHMRNLNTLVCGGSGAGKTRFFCKPNVMQCNTSFVILDPKGKARIRIKMCWNS